MNAMLCISSVFLVKKKLTKMVTREQKTNLSLMTYFVFMYAFLTDNNYEHQLNFR